MRNDRQIIKFGPARYDSPKAIAKITEAKLNTEKTLLPYTAPTSLPPTDPDYTPTYPATEPDSTTNYIPPAVNPPITNSIPNTTPPSGYNPGWTFYSGASQGIPFTVNITNVTWSKNTNTYNYFLRVNVTGFWFFLPYHADNAWSINGRFRLVDNKTIDSNGLLAAGQTLSRTDNYAGSFEDAEQAWGPTKNFSLQTDWIVGPSDFDINAIGVFSFDMVTQPYTYGSMLNFETQAPPSPYITYCTMRYSDTVSGSNTPVPR